MAQFSLFTAGPQVLFDDSSGRVVYIPDVVAADTAQAWFAQLFEGIAWRGGRRMMYEREVDVPRLRAHFELADPALPAPLHEALAAVRAMVDAPFTSVGLNLYRDEHDSVAPHNDKLEDLVRGHPIVLLSLGATREMVIRAKHPPRRVLHLDLAAGSLLLMDYASQFHYDHGIPKQRTPMAPRISLAFRVRPLS
ncbi:alpha-ketoglutarate-dependent dioxygenase AlkB [Frateuria sp. GZRR33]|uniref:alpha-ketoglutarate-dependent dioxygenase AlkB n=1 Tax=Frateuria sp. GZRR33 TaxID=3351535 RepID=UPI003EDC0FED